MIHYTFPDVTTAAAITSSAPGTPFSVSGSPAAAINSFVLFSDQPFHFVLNETATTSNGPRVAALTPVRLTMYGSDELSYILAAGGSSGTLWITKVAS